MYIDDYANEFVHPLMSFPQQLSIRPTLARILFLHREMTEAEGIEYGRNLFLEGDQIVSGVTIRGTQQDVTLDVEKASADPDYIGDFHVHPYRRKMSDTASIGFSTGDIDSYMRKRTPSLRGLDGAPEQRVEGRRRGPVQHQPDVVVRGDGRHAEQGLAIGPALAVLQPALMRQERRAAHEEQREGRKTDVAHRVIAIAPRPAAPVGKTGADRAKLGDQLRHDAHIRLESSRESRRKRKLPDDAAGCAKAHQVLQIRLARLARRHHTARARQHVWNATQSRLEPLALNGIA